MLPDEHARPYRMQILHMASIPVKASSRDNPHPAAQHRRAIRRLLHTSMNLLVSQGFAGYFRPVPRAGPPAGRSRARAVRDPW
jgi:hypothetical protein